MGHPSLTRRANNASRRKWVCHRGVHSVRCIPLARRVSEGYFPRTHGCRMTIFTTWTTYGTWLPGDERCWFQSGAGVQPPSDRIKRFAERSMVDQAYILDAPQWATGDDSRELSTSGLGASCVELPIKPRPCCPDRRRQGNRNSPRNIQGVVYPETEAYEAEEDKMVDRTRLGRLPRHADGVG